MNVKELLDKKKIYHKTSGRDFVINCLNPEHDDSNPSMRVDQVLGIFHCLSCGYKGNIFHYFGEKFNKIDTARETLHRKIEDIRAESVGLRFPEDYALLETDYRVSVETLREFEAFRSSSKDYSNRIIFPIRDLKDKIVCFIGRSEDPYEKKQKYKIYPDRAKVPLFPLSKAVPLQGKFLLVEGLFDMLNLWDNGYRNVVCSFGTSTVSKEKIELLKMMGATGIDICFDPDDAGQVAAEKVKELIEEQEMDVRNINLRDTDPGDLTPNRASRLKEKLYG
jgi:DNA primase